MRNYEVGDVFTFEKLYVTSVIPIGQNFSSYPIFFYFNHIHTTAQGNPLSDAKVWFCMVKSAKDNELIVVYKMCFTKKLIFSVI